MLRGKSKFVAAVVIVAVTLGYLVYAGVKETAVYYLTIEEMLSRTPEVYNDKVRVSGTVVPGTIRRLEDGGLAFSLTDGRNTIDVYYKGIVPDIFTDDAKAIVEGRYTPANTFHADLLLAKCPTKYESVEGLRPAEGDGNVPDVPSAGGKDYSSPPI